VSLLMWPWPTNVIGGMTVSTARNKCSVQSFVFDGINYLRPPLESLTNEIMD
jgi:hypothetical protein